MVPREILKSPQFLRVAVPAALGLLLALLLLAVGCPGEKERLHHRVQRLEREKKAAQASAARWKAESQAKDQSMISFASLILEVGNRIDQIQQDQQGLTALTTQSRGDSWRIVKDKSIPQALDRIDQQLRKNREQIGQLEGLVSRKSTENQVLQAVIERFKRQDEALEQQLVALRRSTGALSKKVKTLETTVGKLADEVGQKEKLIDEREKVIGEQETQLTEQNRQLEAAETERWIRHSAVGTRKELCGLALITPCGLLSSLRQHRLADRYVDAFEACGERCQALDARTAHEISLGKVRGEVKILPPRQADSYAVENRNGEAYLIIRSPGDFWKDRYLVVLVER